MSQAVLMEAQGFMEQNHLFIEQASAGLADCALPFILSGPTVKRCNGNFTSGDPIFVLLNVGFELSAAHKERG
jgi:hypothetical protein